MRDYLDALAQVLALTLCPDHVVVDPAGCDVVVLGHGSVDKTLIVADVHVALAAIVSDKDLSVSDWVHCAGVIVDVRVYLDARHLVACQLEKLGCRRSGNALAKARHDPACNENELAPVRRLGLHIRFWKSTFLFLFGRAGAMLI